MKLIIMGPQGSGKGTHAKLLAQKLGIPHISTGDLLREIASRDSNEGREVKALLATGKLFPDDVMLSLLEKHLKRPEVKHGFILDGFPRTIEQVRMLDAITHIDKVIYLNVGDDECVRRLAGRTQCRNCRSIYGIEHPPRKKGVCDACGGPLYVRDDDREEVVRWRLAQFHAQTEPILDHYRHAHLLVEIEIRGIRHSRDVFQDICRALHI